MDGKHSFYIAGLFLAGVFYMVRSHQNLELVPQHPISFLVSRDSFTEISFANFC